MLPTDVANCLADPEQKHVELLASLKFQVKHYKTMLDRCISKMSRDRKEALRRINQLESKLGVGGRRHDEDAQLLPSSGWEIAVEIYVPTAII
jgi:hypothetical protein